MLVEGEMFMEKLHGGKDTSVAITKFAYISPTATPTRKTVYSFVFFAANFYYLHTIHKCPGKNMGKPHEKLNGETNATISPENS